MDLRGSYEGVARNISIEMDDDYAAPINSLQAFDYDFGATNQANQIVETMRNKAFLRQEFEEVESTSEYAETHYYKYTGGSVSIRVNQYWCDYARHLISGKGLFLSQSFTDCCEDERASYFVICTLDLPMIVSGPHSFKPDE